MARMENSVPITFNWSEMPTLQRFGHNYKKNICKCSWRIGCHLPQWLFIMPSFTDAVLSIKTISSPQLLPLLQWLASQQGVILLYKSPWQLIPVWTSHTWTHPIPWAVGIQTVRHDSLQTVTTESTTVCAAFVEWQRMTVWWANAINATFGCMLIAWMIQSLTIRR